MFTDVTFGISVRDLSKAIEWYKRILGSVEEISPATGVHELKVANQVWLQLLERNLPPQSGAIFRFGVADLESEVARLARAGIDCGAEMTVPGVVRYCEFADPDGNMIGLHQVL